jgi:hypothetical protein
MPEVVDENHFNISIGNKPYHVTVSYEEVYISHYKVETDGKYLVTLCIDEEGNWQAEDNIAKVAQSVIEEIGRAIEEFDAH